MAMPSQYNPAQIEMFLDARIQERIATAQQQTAAGNQAVLENLTKEAGSCITTCQQSVADCESKVAQLVAAAVDADNRISKGIVDTNTALDATRLLASAAQDSYNRMSELEAKMRELTGGVIELGTEWRGQIEHLEQGFDVHVSNRCQKFDADLLELQGRLIAKTDELRQELLVWFRKVDELISRGGWVPGLGGKGVGGK